MVRSDVSYWVAGGTTTSEDPSKYRLESDWSSRRTNPPALQKDLSENINSEEDVQRWGRKAGCRSSVSSLRRGSLGGEVDHK